VEGWQKVDKAQKIKWAELASLMQELKHTGMWACYAEALSDIIASGTESVLQASKEEFEFRKGRVHGLKDALQLPDLIINRSKQS